MLDLAKFKQHLMDSGAVEKEQLERAQKHAFDHGVSLSESLLALNIVGRRKLGQCLAEIYGLPYVPLHGRPLSAEARAVLSAPCAVRWKVFPVSCDRQENIVTLAVHDPDQMVRIEKIFRFLLLPPALGFVIVSRPELDEAFETHYRSALPSNRKNGVALPPEREEKKKFRLSGLRRDAKARSASKTPEAKSGAEPRKLSRFHSSAMAARAVGEQTSPASSGETTVKPDETSPSVMTGLSRTLLSSVALLAQTRLGADTGAVLRAKARVRYSRLLAARMSLGPESCDAVGMAAWVSVLDSPREIVRQLAPPFDLEALVRPDGDTQPDAPTEARILGVVRRYQEFKDRDAQAARDIARVREHLRAHGPAGPEHDALREAFLQILMDEAFLSGMDKATGRILIVDPAETASAALAPPLADDGYEVDVVADGATAEKRVRADAPVAVLVSMDLPRQGGLRLCQKIKSDPELASIPLIALLPKHDETLTTECLRAGCEDCFPKPVELERLFLRLRRLGAPAPASADESGVKGLLAEMSFTDMIQILCAGGKSMEIVLSREGVDGLVHVSEGAVVHAVAGDKTGEEAFYDIMGWKEGEFAMRTRTEFPDRTIQAPLMGLLMEGARRADEG